MADAPRDHETLKTFIALRLDDLVHDRMAPEEAFVLARQYPYLQDVLSARAADLLGADENAFRTLLIDVFRGALARINHDLPPQVQDTQEPIEELSTEEVTAQVNLDTEARRAVREIVTSRDARIAEYRKGFIKRLVDAWIKRSGLTEAEAQKIAHTIEEHLTAALSRVSTATDVAHRASGVLGETAQTVRVPIAPLLEEVRTAEPRYEKALGESERFRQVLPTIVQHPELRRVDWFARFASFETERPETVPAVAEKALLLTKLAEAATVPFAAGVDPTESGVFFESFSKSPLAKPADAVFRTLSPEARQKVVSAVFTRTVGDLTRQSTKLSDRLGEAFVKSPFFAYILEEGKKGLSVGGTNAAFVKTRGIIDDVLTSVLVGPIAATALGSPTEAFIHSLELVEKLNKRLPEGQKLFVLATTPAGPVLKTPMRAAPLPLPMPAIPTVPHVPPKLPVPPIGVTVEQTLVVRWLFSVETFYPMLVYPSVPYVFNTRLFPETKEWFLQFFSKKAGEKAAGKAAAGAGKGLLARILGTGAAKGAQAAAETGVKKGLSGFLVSLAGKLGLEALIGAFTGGTGWLVQAGLLVGGKILGGIVRFGAKIFSGQFITNFFTGIFGGQAGPQKKWYQDWGPAGVLLPGILVGSLLVILVLSRAVQVDIDTPLAIGAVGGGILEEEGIPGVSSLPSYNGPLPPPSAITGCPVSGGQISQCPGGSFSHRGTDAYDISGINNQSVRATHNGYVASYRQGLLPGTGAGFGNYVRLVGSTSGGEAYYTTYAHLRNVSSRVVEAYDALQACMSTPPCDNPPASALITAGTVIGVVDHTGFSTGPHLHYQYNGPGTLQLPMGCGGWNGTCPAN